MAPLDKYGPIGVLPVMWTVSCLKLDVWTQYSAWSTMEEMMCGTERRKRL